MKRILAVCAIGAIVAGAGVARAAVTTNDTQTIPWADFVPCANGGAGEDISGELRLHSLITSTVNGNKVSGKYHLSLRAAASWGRSRETPTNPLA